MASGPLSGMRSVPACRMSRDGRACRAGLRMACASAVAGIVIRGPRSAARATNASTRRSFRSNAIGPPASKVTPLTPPALSLGPSFAPAERETRQPMRVRFWLRDHPFAARKRKRWPLAGPAPAGNNSILVATRRFSRRSLCIAWYSTAASACACCTVTPRNPKVCSRPHVPARRHPNDDFCRVIVE